MKPLSRQVKAERTAEAIGKFCGEEPTMASIAENFPQIWAHVFGEGTAAMARLQKVQQTTNKTIKAPFGNIRTINASEAYRCPNFQRSLDIERVLRYALNFKVERVEVATYVVCDNKKFVVDKQHCFLAACLVGVTEFPTKFTENVTKIGEYFVDLQENRASVSAASKFKVQVNDGTEPQVSIQRLAHQHGFHVDTEEYGSKTAQYVLIKPAGAIKWLFNRIASNSEEGLWVWERYLGFLGALKAKKPEYVLPAPESYSADRAMKAMMRFIDEKDTDEKPLDLDVFVDYIVTRNRAPHDFSIDLEQEKIDAKVKERGVAGMRVMVQWYNKATGDKLSYKAFGKRLRSVPKTKAS